MAKYFGIARVNYEEGIYVPLQNFKSLEECKKFWGNMFYQAHSGLEDDDLYDDYFWKDYVTFFKVGSFGVHELEDVNKVNLMNHRGN